MRNHIRPGRPVLLAGLAGLFWLAITTVVSGAPLPAFPGAEGAGRFTVGGRAGQVLVVDRLADSGPGSLRAALAAEGPRTVVFAVAGTIALKSPLDVRNGHVTIAGQTAPGAGITLRGHGLNIRADEVIVRYLRVRPGDELGVETDAISVLKGHNVIIDHCSASWGTDETLSVSPASEAAVAEVDKVTVQWSIISESLNDSVHSKGPHGYGSLVRGSAGARYTLHHNLWAHHRARMPRPGNYLGIDEDPLGPLIDVRNNVFYNWGGRYSGYNADTDSISRYNFIGNYYLPGPDSRGTIAFDESSPHAELYFAGNYMRGSPVTDPRSVVQLPAGSRLLERPHAVDAPQTEAADNAYNRVLATAGASRVRDAIDARVVAEVRQGTGRIIDDEADVGGWLDTPDYETPVDSDRDGIPDDWERRLGFDPHDPADNVADADGDGYTNLEEYLHVLAADARAS